MNDDSERLRLLDDECLANCAYDLYLAIAKPGGHDFGAPTEKAIETLNRLSRALVMEGMTVERLHEVSAAAIWNTMDTVMRLGRGSDEYKEYERAARVLRALRGSQKSSATDTATVVDGDADVV